MAKDFYLPRRDSEKVTWLNNFASKLPTHASAVGLTNPEVNSVQSDAAMFAYLVDLVEIFTQEKEERVNYKNILRDGPIGAPTGSFPAMPAIPNAPAAVPAGIIPRLRLLVQRIKNHGNYTDATGRDLGIIGAEQTTDTASLKPVLKPVPKGGKVEVQWSKGAADAIHLEVDRGQGWQFLAVDTEPHYTDTAPMPSAGVWKYKAMYLISDEPVGQWSDVVSIPLGQ